MNPADDSAAAFATFSARVKEDPVLLAELVACPEIEGMAARAVVLGRAQGLLFSPTQVRDAWKVASLAWSEHRFL